MAPLDLTGGLPDLDADAPAGPNLELDAEFGELERTAQSTPEKQYGETIIAAIEPEWKDVAAKAEALLDRTRDLRVLVHLAIARLHLSGLPEFAAVVTTIRQLLETRWEYVHPQLDAEDDNDPTLRANALLQLGDPLLVLRTIRTLPLAVSQRDGPVSWRILNVSSGALESEIAEEKKTDAVIRAAFVDTGPERNATLRAVVAGARRDIAAIGTVFDTQCGYGQGPSLDDLTKLLTEIENLLVKHAPPAAAEEEDDAPAEPGPGGAPAASAGPARARGVTAASLNSVDNRADALRLLDLVCRYYEEHEPSSPLPLLIARARKLAEMGFLEILQDLAPDGVGQAQLVVQSREPQ
jgi:type VI secretion system protein ImpA